MNNNLNHLTKVGFNFVNSASQIYVQAKSYKIISKKLNRTLT